MKRNFWLGGVALVIAYLLTRLVNLTTIPIFTDEAIYIRWGQIALQDPAQRFISLEDGKQPLFVWLMLPLLNTFSDPLIAGRLVSVLAGLATMTGLFLLGSRLFSRNVGIATAVIYIISPFFLLYDRLALYDSLTTATMVWALYLSVLTVQTLRLDMAILWGMTIGAGLLTKSSAQFALMLAPASLLLFDWKSNGRLIRLGRFARLTLLMTVLAILYQTILKLSPLSHMIGLKNQTFIVSFSEFSIDPVARLFGNLRGLTDWLVAYLSIPIVVLLVVGAGTGLKRRSRETILCFIWFAVPFMALALFGKVLYPRYLLSMVAPLVPIIALGFSEFWRFVAVRLGSIARILPGVFFAYSLYVSSMIIVDPVNAPLPSVDRNQFFDDWPSGYGIPEVITLLRERGRNAKIFVGTEGTFGLTPSALIIYLNKEPNISIKGYWPIGEGIAELTAIAGQGTPTYLLLKDTQVVPPEWPVIEVARFRKGKGDVYSILLQFSSF